MRLIPIILFLSVIVSGIFIRPEQLPISKDVLTVIYETVLVLVGIITIVVRLIHGKPLGER